MKKITCILILLIMLSTILLPCSAAEYLTEAEAGELINKAVEIYEFTHLDPPLGTIDRNNYIKIEVNYYYSKEDKYISGEAMYYLVIDESKFPSGDYDSLSDYSKSIYTADIADSMYNTFAFAYYDLEFPMFYKSEDGHIYMTNGIGHDWTEVQPWYYGETDQQQFTADNIDIVYADNERATVRYLTQLDRNESMYYGWVECYLVNTDDGWRITDSPFTKMLRYERSAKDLWEPSVIRYTESPSTGDSAAERATLLGAVSLACLIPAACLTIKRRRTVVF